MYIQYSYAMGIELVNNNKNMSIYDGLFQEVLINVISTTNSVKRCGIISPEICHIRQGSVAGFNTPSTSII